MSILPHRLKTRLVLLICVTLMISWALAGWMTSKKQSDMLVESMRTSSSVMARNLAESCAYYLVLNDYAGLESFLLRSAELPDMMELEVREPSGAGVTGVEMRAPGKPVPKLPAGSATFPAEASSEIRTKEERMIIWQPIEAGKRIGWLKATYSMSGIREAQTEALKSSLILVLLWGGASSVVLLLLMRPVIRTFGRLTQFALRLNEQKGSQIQVPAGVGEIEELSASLNYASRTLYASEQQLVHDRERLRKSEENYRNLLNTIQEGIWVIDRDSITTFVNPRMADILGYAPEEMLGRHLFSFMDEQGRALAGRNVERRKQGIKEQHDFEFIRKDGTRVYTRMETGPVMDENRQYAGAIAAVADVTENRRMELEEMAHLRFFESMDRINRAIQGTDDLEQMMREVLDTVMSVFDCDRAFMMYPCDPGAPTWRVPMERTKPEYPGAHALKMELPMDPETSALLQVLLAADGPVTLEPKSPHPFPHELSERFSFKSVMSMAVQPKVGKAWVFGVHQCSYARIWTEDDQKILREVGRRLTDALTGMLVHQDLQKREALLNESQRLGQIGSWDWDAVTDRLWWSDEYYRVYGIDPRTPTPNYEQHLKVYTAESAARLDAAVQRAMKTGEPYELDLELAQPTSSTRWIVARGEALLGRDGKIRGLRGTAQNMTERKLAEDALRRSEQFLDKIVENIPNMLFVKDAEKLRFVRFNRAGERLLGWPRTELLGKSDYDFFPRHVADFFVSKDREALSRQDVTDVPEETIMTRKGEARILHTQKIPIRDESGTPQFLLGISEDITERKERETFIRNILDSVDEGFLIIDREYRVLSANGAFSRLIKMPPEDIVGRPCFAVSHHETRPCFETGHDCPLRQVFETGLSHSGTHMHTDAAGSKVFVEVKAYPIIEPSGKVVSAIQTVNDVTDKRKLEEQLRQAQKMEAVGTLAGGVAHDFNNILTAIIGYGTIVKMKMKPEDPLRSAVEQILAASERAADLTRGLLAFSRKQVLNPRPVDVNEIVRCIQKLLFRLIGEDIELSTRLDKESLIVMADSGQLEQVLMNLATNARDAMPAGGFLTLSTRAVELTEDFMSVHGYGKAGKYACIDVSDTGMGMDEQTREKIFEPFFTTKELGKGTGLGLAIVYGIIKQHNGNINVYSEPGKGTTFKIYLPLIAPEVSQESTSETAAVPRGGTETILLAEDDPTVRELTSTILRDFGYRVIEAVDGQDAVEQFDKQNVVDLLILDVIMPKRTGKEACDAMRVRKPGIRTLFMSGYTADILQKRGLFDKDSQGVDLITKPVSPYELLRKVRELLDIKNNAA